MGESRVRPAKKGDTHAAGRLIAPKTHFALAREKKSMFTLQFDNTSSHFPFFFHFCIFSNSREFLKFETQYSVSFPYSHLIFPLFFFFFFYPLMKLKATQTVCTGFNQWFIDFLHIGPLSFGCL